MNYIRIQKPCSEDWNAMKPNDQGAFCSSCSKDVIDLTRMSTTEIQSVLAKNQHESICTRIQNKQLDALNLEFEQWSRGTRFHMQRAMVASLLIVFGLSLFSCNDEQQQEQIRMTQQKLSEVVQQQQIQTPVQDIEMIESEQIQVMGEVTMGAPEITQQQVFQYLEPVPDPQIVEVYTMLGDIAVLPIYQEYLQQLQPITEYDATGLPVPREFSALTYPNPAIESTTLKLGLPTNIDANIHLFSTQGQYIHTLHTGQIERGTFEHTFDVRDLAPGNYLIMIQSKEFNESVQFVKLP